MSTVASLQSAVGKLPYLLASTLAHTPYTWRPGIGSLYQRRRRELSDFASLGGDERKAFIFQRMSTLVQHAVSEVEFYREFYARKRFRPDSLKSFEHIRDIPVVSKADLQEYALERRSSEQPQRYQVNTGGSSGTPLSFYVLPSCVAHEWAHMHTGWERLGYRPSHLKLVFVGRLSGNEPVTYDPVRHHYAVNIYQDFSLVAGAIGKVLTKRKIRYLHGYPSAIYEFVVACEEQAPEVLAQLRPHLRGVFLGSEYPAAQFRDRIERVLGVPSISWYGHTERAVLAFEGTEKYQYEPFQTYGYCEAVDVENSDQEMLVGTSYYNTASPFIRYCTGDLVTPTRDDNGILGAFKIEQGRQGEYVEDRNGKRIPLTGLVFGRHHRIFEIARSVQVYQASRGHTIFLVSLPKASRSIQSADISKYFDLKDVAMDFELRLVDAPIRTRSGKVNLLVRDQDMVRLGSAAESPGGTE